MAVDYMRRVLERDPHDEQTHLDLVATRTAAGAQGEVRRARRIYVTRMDQIGIQPAAVQAPRRPADGLARRSRTVRA